MTGTPPQHALGGVAEVQINKSAGRILFVIHGK
jgi:hypothetical protein